MVLGPLGNVAGCCGTCFAPSPGNTHLCVISVLALQCEWVMYCVEGLLTQKLWLSVVLILIVLLHFTELRTSKCCLTEGAKILWHKMCAAVVLFSNQCMLSVIQVMVVVSAWVEGSWTSFEVLENVLPLNIKASAVLTADGESKIVARAWGGEKKEDNWTSFEIL